MRSSSIYVHKKTEARPKLKDSPRDAAAKIDRAINAALRDLSESAHCVEPFLRLAAQVRRHSGFLHATPSHCGWQTAVFMIERLKNVALRHRFWKRPCESWIPQDERVRPAFHSLVTHLFDLYPTPEYFDSAWDVPHGPESFRQQALQIRLGRGTNLRALVPLAALTQRMAHMALSAPAHFTISQALRYGEVLGLGGNESLARKVAGSRLGRESAHPAFWRTVLLFLTTHPELPLKHVDAVIEFIHDCKFTNEEVMTVEGLRTRAPSWPDFSMDGRTVNSLLRLLSKWRLDLDEPAFGFSWKPCGLEPYRFIQNRSGEILEWSIVELLGSGALHTEGRFMQHCVFRYVDKCRREQSAIWSLRLRVGGEEKRMATIEVNQNQRAIVQVKALRNRVPGGGSRKQIRQWADSVGLESWWEDRS